MESARAAETTTRTRKTKHNIVLFVDVLTLQEQQQPSVTTTTTTTTALKERKLRKAMNAHKKLQQWRQVKCCKKKKSWTNLNTHTGKGGEENTSTHAHTSAIASQPKREEHFINKLRKKEKHRSFFWLLKQMYTIKESKTKMRAFFSTTKLNVNKTDDFHFQRIHKRWLL